MTTKDFIEQNIGNDVYVTDARDLAFDYELRKIIFNKTKLKLVKMTRSGLAYLEDSEGNFYSVPPSNVREYSELL
ncbi:hypothetical protein M0Q50_07310 [bacterium]|jgi:hypothetical protein|nr:hypothetical protein [bacterium]